MLLKFRLRSENEIRQRLKRKKFAADIVESTISFLKENKFIDDKYFAKIWIESGIKRPLGIRRLRQELRMKGIDKEIIDTQINEIKKSYSEEDIVTNITQDKLNKIKGIEPQKAKKRVYAYLLRRGFSPEVVIDVFGQIKNRESS